jgi:GGDEF domain-containing protein
MRATRQAPIGSVGEILLSRQGGDEFGILLERASEPSDAMRLANRVQTELTAPLSVKGREVSITASIGIALSSTTQEHAEDLLRDAKMPCGEPTPWAVRAPNCSIRHCTRAPSTG